MLRFETERLLLRPLEREDIFAVVDLWTDPQVTSFLGGPRDRDQVTAALEEELLVQPREPFELCSVFEKASGDLVGHCGLLEKEVQGRTEFDLVYVFARSAWGRGYATEIGRALIRFAFEQVDLTRVVCLIEPENMASRRVAEKIGMLSHGQIKRPGDRIVELYMLAQPEWRATVLSE